MQLRTSIHLAMWFCRRCKRNTRDRESAPLPFFSFPS
jgi:hypothetical protein